MVQSIKAVCGLVIMVSIIIGVIVWLDNPPNEITGKLRIWTIVAAAVSLTVIGLLSLRRDEAPDFLYRISPRYFLKNGFGFILSAEEHDGICLMCVHYQNQHENFCKARVAFQPVPKSSKSPTPEVVTTVIECPPAGFGIVRIPYPVPESLQGTW